MPTANAHCERLIGTIRRECLDYLVPLNSADCAESSANGFVTTIPAAHTGLWAQAFPTVLTITSRLAAALPDCGLHHMLLPSRFSVACIANLAMQFTLAGSYSRYGGYALTDDINIPDRNSLFQAVRDLMGAGPAIGAASTRPALAPRR
jgi:hypothetical protein